MVKKKTLGQGRLKYRWCQLVPDAACKCMSWRGREQMIDRSNTSAPLTDQVSAAMLHNVGLFLKRAAEEIAAHGDGSNATFGIDRTTLVTVLMQIAVELSATALVLKHEGFVGVTKPKDLPTTDAEAKALGEEAKIRTINFEQMKPKAAKYLGTRHSGLMSTSCSAPGTSSSTSMRRSSRRIGSISSMTPCRSSCRSSMVGPPGLEPGTSRLKVACSTD